MDETWRGGADRTLRRVGSQSNPAYGQSRRKNNAAKTEENSSQRELGVALRAPHQLGVKEIGLRRVNGHLLILILGR
jgi:hypothetical protein